MQNKKNKSRIVPITALVALITLGAIASSRYDKYKHESRYDKYKHEHEHKHGFIDTRSAASTHKKDSDQEDVNNSTLHAAHNGPTSYKPDPSKTKECKYASPNYPKTSIHLGDKYLESYPYYISSIIVKEARNHSTHQQPPDIDKYQRDSGESGMRVDTKAINGAYVVELGSPKTAAEIASIVQKMMIGDAPKQIDASEEDESRCRYEYIEANWLLEKNSDLSSGLASNEKLAISNEFYYSFFSAEKIEPSESVHSNWDWLGGNLSKFASIGVEEVKNGDATYFRDVYTTTSGSNFVDAWVYIYKWLKSNPLKNKLNPVKIAIVDTKVLNTGAKYYREDVKFISRRHLVDNGSAVSDNGLCNTNINTAIYNTDCHGEDVARVLASYTFAQIRGPLDLQQDMKAPNQFHGTGSPGALGIGTKYGNTDIFEISAIQTGERKPDPDLYKNRSSEHQLIPGTLITLSDILRGLGSAVYGINFNSSNMGDIISSPNMVVNISLGGGLNLPCSYLSADLIKKISKDTNNKVVIVSSAGNSNGIGKDIVENHRGPLASCDNIIAVTAHNRSGARIKDYPSGIESAFTKQYSFQDSESVPANNQWNYFPISAPGYKLNSRSDLYDTYPVLSRNKFLSGTSFSAAQVSAAAALMKAIDPTLTSEMIANIINSTGLQPPADKNLLLGRKGVALDAGKAIEKLIDIKSKNLPDEGSSSSFQSMPGNIPKPVYKPTGDLR